MDEKRKLKILLRKEIIKDESKVTIKQGEIVFNLKKKIVEDWSELKHENSSNGKVLAQEFQKLLDQEQIEMEKLAEQKRIDNRKNKDSSVQRQIAVDAEKRQKRENFKENEKVQLSEKLKGDTVDDKIEKKPKSQNDIFHEDGNAKEAKVILRRSKLPPPRQQTKIKVQFTERVFPTPLRESHRSEENEWLQKQAFAKKKMAEIELDLLPKEREIGHLEEKGIKLMQNGDFEGAVNALNIANQLFPLIPSVYLHRATANLGMNNCVRAAKDAARALEMYTPPVESNLSERIKCHLLRGRSLRHLQMLTEALMDFTEAEKLDPKNQLIIDETNALRTLIETNGDDWKQEWENDLL